MRILMILCLALAGCLTVSTPPIPEPGTADGGVPAEAGPPGPPGPPGPAGAEGANVGAPPRGLARADTYTVIAPLVTFGPGTGSASASCRAAADTLVTGGCLGEAALTSSAPILPEDATEPAYWLCLAMNPGPELAELTAMVVCAPPVP